MNKYIPNIIPQYIRNRLWLIKDSCGLTCCLFTYLVLSFVFIGVTIFEYYNAFANIGPLVYLAFVAIYILIIWSHLTSVFTCPGVIPKSYSVLEPENTPSRVTFLIQEVMDTYKKHQDMVGEALSDSSRESGKKATMKESFMIQNGKRWETRKRIITDIMSRTCKKCNSIKPPKTHHCKTCQRYIYYIQYIYI